MFVDENGRLHTQILNNYYFYEARLANSNFWLNILQDSEIYNNPKEKQIIYVDESYLRPAVEQDGWFSQIARMSWRNWDDLSVGERRKLVMSAEWELFEEDSYEA